MFLSQKCFVNVGKNLVKYYSSNHNNIKKRICIVGGGPAGFYAAQYLIKHLPDSYVDIIEKLPVPFGLVRYGVAPDHPEVKNVISTFTKVAENPRVRFFGNISLGRDVNLKELKENYHAVLLAYGANMDRKLNIPNESNQNVISAREFVAWYNGLPGAERLDINLKKDNVAIIGQGNVAIDIARVLLSPIDQLKHTDITSFALDHLMHSKVKKVYLIGRRGPLQAAFTIKELREILNLKNCSTIWRESDFDGVQENLENLQRPRKRLTELMLKSLTEQKSKMKCKYSFNPIFFRAPKSILSNGIELSHTKLDGDIAVEIDKNELLECDLIFRSIGYVSANFDEDINFNEKKGQVNNIEGRVIKKGLTGSDHTIDDIEDKFEKGLYVAGWLGTGPTGVILTTMNNSFSVANTICKDITSEYLPIKEQKPGLNLNNKQIVTWKHWKMIDEKEKHDGHKMKKPREKLIKIEDMLKAAGL